jgi:hypothetical protein
MQNIPEPKEIKDNNPERLYAGIKKDDLKALYYLMAGKPDSNIKLFHDPISIEPNDIIELNDNIQEKLQNHNVDAGTTTVTINYTSNETEQFGIWAEFITHKWNTYKEIEEITIKWDFLVSLPTYKFPQRHTIVLKVSSRLTPLHLFQAMFSNDSDDLENIENEIAPVICRIDFINHVLSDELMSIVENWIKSRIKPLFDPVFGQILENHKAGIARFLHYSIPIFITILAAGVLNKIVNSCFIGNTPVTVNELKIFMFWLLGSGVVIFIFVQIGFWIGSRAYKSIESYGEHCVFNFTNGDKNKHLRLAKNNKRSVIQIISSIVLNFIINISASIVSYFLFTK